jgi:tetratricopeptide (TPR) repeat protein
VTRKHRAQLARPSAQRKFTDREDFVASFRRALEQPGADRPTVLVFYGVGGIGKTSLRKELVDLLEDAGNVRTWAVLDFEIPGFREQETALFSLRRSLKDRYGVKFPTFDIAYGLLWRKTRPQIPLNKDTFPLLEGEGPIADMIRIVGALSGVSLISLAPTFSRLAFRGHKWIMEWWTRRGQRELDALPQLEARDIAERLPSYWAADLRDHLDAKRSQAVLFVDSYEALWEGARSEARVFKQDEWVRDLIGELPEVLWVVCGREKLRWEEYDPEWAGRLSQHLVGGLSDDDAHHFLESCGIWDTAVRQIVVESSRGVPYYLDLAVDTYFDIKFRQEREPVAGDFARTTRDVLTRFLRNLDRAEIETLKVLSVARFWDFTIFGKVVAAFSTGYPATAFAELSRFSFIHRGEMPDTWAMHQLMRESLSRTLDPQLAIAVHRLLFDHHTQALDVLDARSITSRHRAALAEAFHHGRAVLTPEALFKWFQERARVFAQAAQWRFLTPMAEEVSELIEQNLGLNDPLLATALGELALLYSSQGRYGDAEPLQRWALGIREQALGPDHPDVAATLRALAALRSIQGHIPEAEALLRRALAISEKALGSEHPDTLETEGLLADACREQGRHSEAESLYRRVMAIWEKTLGPNDLRLGGILNNLAILLWIQGRYPEAEPHFRRALAIRESVLGPEHPDVGELLNNLAVLYRRMGRLVEAEPLYERALSVRERALGPDHPAVAQSLNNLGLLYWNLGEYVKSEHCLKRAIEIMQRSLGTEHGDLANFLNSMAGLYWKTGRLAEAEPLFRRSKAMTEKFLGPEHPAVAESLANLAGLCNDQGRCEEAEQLITQAVAIQEKVLGPNHPGLGRSLNTLANIRRNQGRPTEAESAYERAHAILEKALGPGHADTVHVLEDLAKLYLQTGRDAEAEAIQRRLQESRTGH